MDSVTREKLDCICKDIRRDIIRMIFEAGSGHPGGSLSAVEILVVLYFHYMKIDPKNPKWVERDKFILSKGHAAPLLYAILAEREFFPLEELSTFNAPGTALQKHIDMKLVPGTELSTGSLGQGLSAALGMCLSDRLDKRKSRTFVLLGDGECQEGQVWEAAMAAAQHRVGNLVCFLDNNGCQVDGYTRDICMLEPVEEKWSAFRWDVQRIDGHDIGQIEDALLKTELDKNRPHMIIADTIKGKGVSFMENKPEWHAKALNDEEYAMAMEGLGLKGERLMTDIFENRPFGHCLAELGEKYKDIVVLDADLQRATETNFFQESFPERYFDVGIAEANMVGMAAGFALMGKTAFCGTFSSFISQRVCDQVVVSVAYCSANVKLMGIEPGIASGRNGASHQAVLDIAIMRSIPNMTVFEPADAVELRAIMAYLAATKGPAYMRVPRGNVPIIFSPDTYEFNPGKAVTVQNGDDAAIITSGILLPEVMKAAEVLRAKHGRHVRVLNMSSLKPFDKDAVIKAAKETKNILTVENHNIYGGLGSLVAETVCEDFPVRVKRMGIRDRFGEVGPEDWLLSQFGLDEAHITASTLAMIA